MTLSLAPPPLRLARPDGPARGRTSRSRGRGGPLLAGVLAGAVASSMPGAGIAAPVPESEILDRTERLPHRLEGVDVRERLGEQVPAALPLLDEAGRSVKLGDYLDGALPVVLTFNYSNCPMLCSLQLGGLTRTLRGLEGFAPGSRFRVVTVSLDPKETPESASRAKARYLSQYGDPAAGAGWHFLSAPEPVVRALAESVGYSYAWNEKRQEWLHPAAVVVLSPTGKVTRYLYGLEVPPRTLRLSLVEASEGRVGTTVDRVLLYCFHYDEQEGRYAPVARNIMKLGGGLSVLALGGFLLVLWRGEARKRQQLSVRSETA